MTKFLDRDVQEFALRYFEGLGDSRALSLAILLRYGEYDQIAQMRCDPKSYLHADGYAKAAAASALLRKCRDLPTTFDRVQRAKDNWWASERECYKSNLRLARCLPEHGASDDFEPEIAAFYSRVKRRVASWIGNRPKGLTPLKFGPGSTYADKGLYTTVPDKMSSVPTLTRDAMYFLPQWLETAWGRHCAAQSRSPVFVRGNRFATAPKDAEKDRGIAIEASLNVVYQLGTSVELRSHMKRHGIDLDQGQFIHRRVAALASRENGSATLDATNASDTQCYNLVKLCTPRLWFEHFAMLRAEFTLIDNKWVKLEKFSSMGNGYTFELETIIFAALCCEALASAGFAHRLGKDVYVYGDDMIVPRDGVHCVTAVLKHAGISLNLSKSFFDGEFRESCGGDYFRGSPVRPFYLKEVPSEPQQWIAVANGVTRTTWELGRLAPDDNSRAVWDPLSRDDGFGPSGSDLRRAWHFAIDRLPRSISRCRGPQGLGDLVINDRERMWRVKSRNSIRYVNVYRPCKHRKVSYGLFHPDVVLACATYGLGWGNGGVTPRDSVLGYKVGWVPYS